MNNYVIQSSRLQYIESHKKFYDFIIICFVELRKEFFHYGHIKKQNVMI